MVKLVLRLAGMTEQNDNIPHTHSKVGTLAGIIGIVCNLLLFILKVLVGILSGAVSVTEEALRQLEELILRKLPAGQMPRLKFLPPDPVGDGRQVIARQVLRKILIAR